MNKKIVWLPYDFDTAIGINNEGALVFSYNLEDTDHLEGGADVFNGQESVVWTNIRDAFRDELMQMYQTLRSTGALSYDKVEQMFEEHQEKWPEVVFNEDAWFKYIAPLVSPEAGAQPTGAYLSMMQGSKEEQRKWWLYNRFRYIDSKYNAGDSLSDVITVRGYAKANITITPYADIYPSVKYGSYLVQMRGQRGVASEIVCPLDNVNDTEIYIYSASQLAEIGDLSGLLVGFADFSMGTKLQHLKVGDSSSSYANTNLKELYLGNNVLLKTLDVRNCTALGTGDQKTVDISGCVNIEEVYFDNTALSGVTLPNGGVLNTLHLPSTITNLTILNQKSLTNLVASYSNISTLRLENNGNGVDALAILRAVPANTRVRLIGFTWEAQNATEISGIFDLLDTMRGLDESGGNVDTAQVSGTIHTSALTGEQIADFNSRYPYVNVTADHISVTLTYRTYDGSSVIATETVLDGGNGTRTNSTARASTAQYTYTPDGWATTPNGARNDSALLNVTTNRDVYAAYIATIRTYTVRFYNGSTLLQTVTNVQYGGSATYTGSTPTDSSGNPFAGFEPTGQNITGDTNCYAQFTSPEPAHTITDTWAGILQHVQQGDYATRYAVGDTMSLNLGSEGYINMQIAGFDVDKRADGQGKAHISWISEELLNTVRNMNEALKTNYKYEEGPSFVRDTTSTTSTHYNRWDAKNSGTQDNTAKITITVTAVDTGTLKLSYSSGTTNYSNRTVCSLKVDNIEVANDPKTASFDLSITAGATYIIEFMHTQLTTQEYEGWFKLANASGLGTKSAVDALVTQDSIVVENCLVMTFDNYEQGTGTIGGWEHSEMRDYLRNTVKPLIPSEVRNAILEVTKTQPSYNTAGTSETQTTTDDVWIPSTIELVNDLSHGGLYYDLFNGTDTNRIKNKFNSSNAYGWWLRSASNKEKFVNIKINGATTSGISSNNYGVALGFCI